MPLVSAPVAHQTAVVRTREDCLTASCAVTGDAQMTAAATPRDTIVVDLGIDSESLAT
jgi:hypothetical protein